MTKWEEIQEIDRTIHLLNSCKGCRLDLMQDSFPKTIKEGKRDDDKIQRPLPFKEINVSLPVVSPTKRKSINYQKAAAEEFFESATKTWEDVYETPLNKVLPKVCNLTPRKSRKEKKSATRKRNRNFKQSVEDVLSKKGMLTFFGTRESASGYKKRRRSLYFEDKETASERSKQGNTKNNDSNNLFP